MNIYDAIVSRQARLSVVGLGYVGLPIAVAFARKAEVIGFDVNSGKIALYLQGRDPTGEVGSAAISATTVEFTSDETRLRDAAFHIVAVPTPVNSDHTPDLSPLESACRILGRNLRRGSVVVFESTVYPGVTELICVPLLEAESGLRCGADFKVGYSPERINPGDHEHRLETIVKIVSGMDRETLDLVTKIYELVVTAGVHRAESIQIAEAAKVIENSQRDINIAFMNELSIIFNKLGIDTKAVLQAAGTKWNFLKFTPGLVGGHCIGVDPYYLTYRAEQIGYHSQVILAGRKINDDMGKYVAMQTAKTLVRAGRPVNGSRVAVLGITFKENCPDVRNSKVVDIIRELGEYGVETQVVDPLADPQEVRRTYRLELCRMNELRDLDGVVFAVPHGAFLGMKLEAVRQLFSARGSRPGGVLIDVKGVFDRHEAENLGLVYWRL